MITGIYGLTLIYFKGANFFRISLVIISCIAVLITGTKTPIPVAILSYLLISTEKINTAFFLKIITGIAIVIIISYFALIYIIPENISSRVLNLGALSVASQSTEGNRLELYNLAIEIIIENYSGTGFGGFSSFHRFIVVPHNIFLENAVEMGVFSAIAFVAWSLYIVILSKRNKTKNIHLHFVKILFIYMLISLMFGGETTIQSFLLYLSGSIVFLNYKNG